MYKKSCMLARKKPEVEAVVLCANVKHYFVTSLKRLKFGLKQFTFDLECLSISSSCFSSLRSMICLVRPTSNSSIFWLRIADVSTNFTPRLVASSIPSDRISMNKYDCDIGHNFQVQKTFDQEE